VNPKTHIQKNSKKTQNFFICSNDIWEVLILKLKII
jgi:hypothetical protein